MKNLDRRLDNLEHRLGIAKNQRRFRVLLDSVGMRGLSNDRCIQILQECGFLNTGLVGIADFTQIPNGLNANETERFVRDNGARICGSQGGQSPGAPGIEGAEKGLARRVVIELE
jgi:hypothetical protein